MSSYFSSIHSTYFSKLKKNIIIPPMHQSIYIYPTIHLSIHTSIYSLFINFQFTYLSIHFPSIYQFNYSSGHSSIHLYIYILRMAHPVRRSKIVKSHIYQSKYSLNHSSSHLAIHLSIYPSI